MSCYFELNTLMKREYEASPELKIFFMSAVVREESAVRRIKEKSK